MFFLIMLLIFIIGIIIYVNISKNKILGKIRKSENKSKKYFTQDKKIREEIKNNSKLRYISDYVEYPITNNNDIYYYTSDEDILDAMLEEIKKAKKFIFMEYFTITPGEFWDKILKALEERANKGVEVRVIYDDVGSLTTLSRDYPKYLEKKKIKCVVFNKINPLSFPIMNNRNHRKMTIVDGKVAFTGGINLADECINIDKKYGYWKDSNIKIVGDAIWTYTVMFLSIWNVFRESDKDFLVFKYNFKNKKTNKSFIVPYGDTPLDKKQVSKNIYLNIINEASKYLYISTPYLIIDNDMINSLILAKKRGVDVRIVIPGIPDKKIIYTTTEIYAERLVKNGIKIYKYTPGFNHAKVFIADDKVATVGTINLDYRSLYLHFECGCYLENDKVLNKIKKDIEEMIEESLLLDKKSTKPNFFKKPIQAILKIFAPLM